jgi:hypothetical protein
MREPDSVCGNKKVLFLRLLGQDRGHPSSADVSEIVG